MSGSAKVSVAYSTDGIHLLINLEHSSANVVVTADDARSIGACMIRSADRVEAWERRK